MKSFHNLNSSFQSSPGFETCVNPHHHESSSSASNSPPTSYMLTSSINVLNSNSGSRSLFMTSNGNNQKNFLRIPDALTAPPSPSIQVQSFNPPLSSSTPPSPILSNKNLSTGYSGNNNDSNISVRIVETDPLEKRFVLYRVEVTLDGQKWFIRRRYSEFHHLLEVVSVDIQVALELMKPFKTAKEKVFTS